MQNDPMQRLLYLLARFRARETFACDEADWGYAIGMAAAESAIRRESDELDALLAELLPRDVAPHPNAALDQMT